MQLAIEVPDKLAKKFIKNYKDSQRKKIVTEAIKNKLERKKDSLWNITKIAQEVKDNDVAKNHDKYLIEDLVKRKTNL